MKKLFAILVPLIVVGAGFLLYRDFRSSRGDVTAGATAAPPGGAGASSASAGGTDDTVSGQRDTMIFWNPATGAGRRWQFAGGAAPSAQEVQQAGGAWVPIAMARRGWGGSDAVMWLQSETRELHYWRIGDDGVPTATEVVPYRGTEWDVIALADADDDGDADLVWRGADGSIAVWLMRDGKAVAQSPVGADAGRVLATVADLNGDARDELVWRDSATGQYEVWTLDGVKPAQARPLEGANPAWRIVAAARIDDDASDDLVWANDSTQQLSIWLGGDAARGQLIQRPSVAGWSLAASADVDGDGRAELVWTNDADGTSGAWRIDRDGAVTDLPLPATGVEWRVVPVGIATSAPTGPVAQGEEAAG